MQAIFTIGTKLQHSILYMWERKTSLILRFNLLVGEWLCSKLRTCHCDTIHIIYSTKHEEVINLVPIIHKIYAKLTFPVTEYVTLHG
jgi:hypothetical protein